MQAAAQREFRPIPLLGRHPRPAKLSFLRDIVNFVNFTLQLVAVAAPVAAQAPAPREWSPAQAKAILDKTQTIRLAPSLAHLTPGEVERGFPELHPLLGQCRFANCAHLQEPGCAVIAARDRGDVAPRRYELFAKLTRESSTFRDR